MLDYFLAPQCCRIFCYYLLDILFWSGELAQYSLGPSLSLLYTAALRLKLYYYDLVYYILGQTKEPSYHNA